MKKIIIDNMELFVENYNRDYIKSEISGENLIRIKCETVVKSEDNEKLKKLLDNKNFHISIPDEKLQFSARRGEISYYYTDGNPFKDGLIDYTHVLEIIEFEEVKEIQSSKKASLEAEILLLKKRLSIVEKVLLDKGIISKDDLDEIIKNKLN